MAVNPAKPRRGSFEVTLLRPDGSSEWGRGLGDGAGVRGGEGLVSEAAGRDGDLTRSFPRCGALDRD